MDACDLYTWILNMGATETILSGRRNDMSTQKGVTYGAKGPNES